VSRAIGVPETDIVISDESDLVINAGEALQKPRYQVRLTQREISIVVKLSGNPSEVDIPMLTRILQVDFAHDNTVGDLTKRTFSQACFTAPIELFRGDARLPPQFVLRTLPDHSEIVVRYPAPAPGSRYNFLLPNGEHSSAAWPGLTVLEVKRRLLPVCRITNALPTVLELSFWEIKLPNESRFDSFRIPADGEIIVSSTRMREMTIALPDGSSQVFRAGASSRVAELKELIGQVQSIPVRDFVLQSTADVDESVPISDVPEVTLRVVDFAGLPLRLFDSKKKRSDFSEAENLHKISDLKTSLLSFPDLCNAYVDLAESKVEFRFETKLLKDTDLVPRPPRGGKVEIEFRVFARPKFTFVCGSLEQSLCFDEGATVGTALRRLASIHRVPLKLLMLEAGGRTLREDPLLTSLGSTFVWRVRDYVDLPVRFGLVR
jgi:hypothetical protein